MPLNEQRTLRETRGGSLLACQGKARFSLQQQGLAQSIAGRMSKSKHERITVFRCPHCNGLHVGNDMRRK